jgi:diacylglycerol kinase family enzyme
MHKILAVLYKFFAGKHEDLAELDNVICDEVVYTSKDGSPMILNCDGEIYQLSTFTCQVRKHAYKRII